MAVQEPDHTYWVIDRSIPVMFVRTDGKPEKSESPYFCLREDTSCIFMPGRDTPRKFQDGSVQVQLADTGKYAGFDLSFANAYPEYEEVWVNVNRLHKLW